MPFIPIEYSIEVGSPYLLPLVDVFVLSRRKRAHVRAVVDSGAQMPVFPLHAAQSAGIELPSGPNGSVLYGGSATPAWNVQVYLEFVGQRWLAEVAFVERLLLPYALLGRRGVFGQFNEVAFIERIRAPRVEFRF